MLIVQSLQPLKKKKKIITKFLNVKLKERQVGGVRTPKQTPLATR